MTNPPLQPGAWAQPHAWNVPPTAGTLADGPTAAERVLKELRLMARPLRAPRNCGCPIDRHAELVFQQLVIEWRAEWVATDAEPMAQQAFQHIVALGRTAVPLLLVELERGPGPWHHALSAITGVDPVPADCRGQREIIVQAWRAWARAQGLAR